MTASGKKGGHEEKSQEEENAPKQDASELENGAKRNRLEGVQFLSSHFGNEPNRPC
jgi:hypothetical protein